MSALGGKADLIEGLGSGPFLAKSRRAVRQETSTFGQKWQQTGGLEARLFPYGGATLFCRHPSQAQAFVHTFKMGTDGLSPRARRIPWLLLMRRHLCRGKGCVVIGSVRASS